MIYDLFLSLIKPSFSNRTSSTKSWFSSQTWTTSVQSRAWSTASSQASAKLCTPASSEMTNERSRSRSWPDPSVKCPHTITENSRSWVS